MFVTPLKEADKVGVWTVNGKEFSFDAINQLKAIKDAADIDNQIKFQEALDAAGITYADELKIADYLLAVKDDGADLNLGEEFTIETLADVQKVINAVDKKATDEVADAAKVKAVVDAKTQAQLLKALQANFDAVNSEWIVKYFDAATVNVTDAEGVKASDIQAAIYVVNGTAIGEDAPTTAAEQAQHTTLIEKWMKPDGEGETAKATAIAASKEAEAKFRVVEATTPNTLYNALVSYANIIADEEDDTILKVSDLNSNLKAFYFDALEALKEAETPLTDINTQIVEAADAAAKESALTDVKSAYEAINTAEAENDGAGEATAKQKADLKAALQKLATVTSHKTGDDKFDMSIVKDANLVAYAEEFAKDVAIDETSAVTAVIADVNTVNSAVETDALYDALNTAKTATEVNNALISLGNANYINVPSGDRMYVAEALLNRENPVEITSENLVATVQAAIQKRTDFLADVNDETTIAGVQTALGKGLTGFKELSSADQVAKAEAVYNALVALQADGKEFTTVKQIKDIVE